MKNKIFITLTLFCLVVCIWIVKANTHIFKNTKSVNSTINDKTTLTKKNVKQPVKKVSSDPDVQDDNYSYISIKDLYLEIGRGSLMINEITPNSAKTVFGTPKSEITEYSEIDDANILVYKYEGGTLSFLNNELLHFNIEDEGFSIKIKRNDSSYSLMTSGTDSGELYDEFTRSYENITNHTFQVFIVNNDGKILDQYLTFTLNNGEDGIHTITYGD